MDKLVNLTLPEFAFVEGSEHEKNNILSGRIVILHIRSASVVEILDRDNSFLTEGVLAYNFPLSTDLALKNQWLPHCTIVPHLIRMQTVK